MVVPGTLQNLVQSAGFERFGFVSIARPLSLKLYRQWLADGCHGDMHYLERHLPFKEQPQTLLPKARSAIVVAQDYYPAEPAPTKVAGLRTALYARSSDYHDWFQGQLEELKSVLQTHFPDDEFLCCTDSKPVAERELAVRAGLGWIGKNGCLIDRRHGSLFFIGEILTSLDLNDARPLVPDHCGTCDRCQKACPTEAIRSDRTLDARKCISYWTIEAKAEPPPDLRGRLGDWFFGCDICQTVCPWNEKAFDKQTMRSLSAERLEQEPPESELRWCLTASNLEIEKAFAATALSRARARGIRRNALIVIANRKMRNLRPDVERLAAKHPQLSDLAAWTLSKLKEV